MPVRARLGSSEDVPEKTPAPAALAVEEALLEAAGCTPSEQEPTTEEEVRATEQPSAEPGTRRTESSASQGSVDMVEPAAEATRRQWKEMTAPRPTFLGKTTEKRRYNSPPNVSLDDRGKKPS